METQKPKRPQFEATDPSIERENTAPKEQPFLPTIKVECKNLPSHGVPYPEGAWIEHRPYMFGEVKRISQSKLDNENSYKEILSGINCSFDKMKLTVPDVLYIGLLRKLSTLGTTEIIARYKCNKCDKPGQFIFKTDDLEFDDLKARKLPIVVDMSFGTVHFHPLTVKDYLDMAAKGKIDDEIALYAMQAKNMKYDEAYKQFFNASPEDAALLLEVDNLLYHSLKAFTKQCTNLIGEKTCGNPIRIELDGGQALLLPFRRDEGPSKSKIRFGLEDER